MKSKCRLCGDLKSVLVDIFGPEGQQLLLYVKIKANIYIHLSENDPFPKSVCGLCLARLDSVCEFQEMCRRAQLVFRKDFDEECAKRCLQEIKKLDKFKVHFLDNDLHSTTFKEHRNEPVKAANSVNENNSLLYAILETEYIAEDKRQTRAASLKKRMAANAHLEMLAVEESGAEESGAEDQPNGSPDVLTPTYSETSALRTFVPFSESTILHTPNRTINSQTPLACLMVTPELPSHGRFVSSSNDVPAGESSTSASSPVRVWVSETQIIDSGPSPEPVHSDGDSNNGWDNSDMVEEENSGVNNTRCVYPETLKAYLKRSLRFMKSATRAELVALPNRCHLCNKGTSRATLRGHLEMHLNHLCKVCGKAFTKRSQFVFHQASHVNARRFACSKCDKKFNQRKSLLNHDRKVHGLERYFCDDCGKGFRNKVKLFAHLQVVHARKYKCHMCDTMYSDQNGLLEHQSDKHKLATPGNFSEKYLLPTHTIVSASSDSTTNICTVLAVESNLASGVTVLKSDRNLNSGWNNFSIDDQDKSDINDTRCVYPETLKTYLERGLRFVKSVTRAELVTLPNRCPLCNKGTSRATHRRHLEMHLNNLCNVCGKAFTKRNQFVFHQASHVNARRFACSKCDKKFNQQKSLSNHDRKVHGPKRYFCDDCGKGYGHKVKLFAHLQVVHARKYKCHVCDAMYSDQSSLIEHQSYKHKQATPANFSEKDLSPTHSVVVSTSVGTTDACTVLAVECDLTSGVTAIDCDRNLNSGCNNIRIDDQDNSDVNNTRCVYPETLKAYLERSLQFMKNASQAELAALPNHCPLCNIYRGTSPILLRSHFERHLKHHCNMCSKTFAKKKNFVFHQESHVNERRFACSKCDKKFNQIKSLSDHDRNVHGPERYFCEDCGKGYRRKVYLFAHLQFVHGRKYKCHMCDAMYSDQSGLVEHQSDKHILAMSVHSSEKNLLLTNSTVASWPNVTAEASSELAVEQELVDGVAVVDSDRNSSGGQNIFTTSGQNNSGAIDRTCDYPETLVTYLHRTLLHMKKATVTELSLLPNSCAVCTDYVAYNPRSLQRHLEQHLTWRCDECERTFANKRQFQYHQRTHDAESLYACSKCDKKFLQKAILDSHIATHEPKSFFCNDCGHGFTKKTSLTNHIRRVHFNIKNHKCHICEKTFSTVRHLADHLSRHNRMPNYMCDTCGKAFYTGRALLAHVQLIHIAEKPHKCNECDGAFKTKFQLRLHQLVHTGEKPWCCDQCGKSFARVYTLEKHIKSIHMPKTVVCPLCPKTFSFEAYLLSHMANHVKQEDDEMSADELAND